MKAAVKTVTREKFKPAISHENGAIEVLSVPNEETVRLRGEDGVILFNPNDGGTFDDIQKAFSYARCIIYQRMPWNQKNKPLIHQRQKDAFSILGIVPNTQENDPDSTA